MYERGCDHAIGDAPELVCAHLLGVEDPDYYRWYTGEGMRSILLCQQCFEQPEQRAGALRQVCRACFERLEDGQLESVGGMPQVLERPTSLRFAHRDLALPADLLGDVLAIAPLPGEARSVWVALTSWGALVRLDLDAGAAQALARLPQGALDLAAPLSLHLAPDGRAAAVANTYGSFGRVVDLASGAATMELDRKQYHVDVCQFPLGFFMHGGRLLLIHATGWNRLDVSDPLTGELLTPRAYEQPAPMSDKKVQPEHYLNYFHAGLQVSPDGRWVADAGWVWSPVGIVRTWSLADWLGQNPWESEDGASERRLTYAHYLWDSPMCWVGDSMLAIWGVGCDEEAMLPAVQLFDVPSSTPTRAFGGPQVAPHSGWPPRVSRLGWLAYDRWLFAISPEHGTGVWDLATGERLHHAADLTPTAYHPGARQFLTLLPGGAARLSALEGEA